MFVITGSSGTTYLMHLLTELGLDTGFPIGHPVNPQGDFEWTIKGKHVYKENMPTIIKSPKLSDTLLDRAKRWDWDVERVYILMRNYEDIAKSWYDVDRAKGRTTPKGKFPFITGDLTEEQHISLCHMKAAGRIGTLMLQLVTSKIPYTFLLFPRIVTDPDYLYTHCALFHDVKYQTFLEVFNRIADVKKVHHGLKHI